MEPAHPSKPYSDPGPNPYQTLLPSSPPQPRHRGIRSWLALIAWVLVGIVALSFFGFKVYRGQFPGAFNTNQPILAQAVYQDFVTAGIETRNPSFNTGSCNECPSKPTATAAWFDTSSGYEMNIYTFRNSDQAQAVAALGTASGVEEEKIGVCLLYFSSAITDAQLAPYVKVMNQVC
jgi:hypothetical protein